MFNFLMTQTHSLTDHFKQNWDSVAILVIPLFSVDEKDFYQTISFFSNSFSSVQLKNLLKYWNQRYYD